MCFFNSGGGSYSTQETKKVEEEKANAKARLLGTSGENKGAQLQTNQGQSIRKVFGN